MNGNRILVVDDDRDFTASLADILDEFGFPADTAPNGAEALRLTEQDPLYRLFLLDYKMPGMDGVELCRRLRKWCPHSRAVFVTACTTPDFLETFAGAGADHVLPKPVDFGALMALLHAYAEEE